jgi:hypothetical protein
MRVFILSLFGCAAIAFGGYAYAYSDDSCGDGECGPSSCNPYESNCQCTDPLCSKPMYTDCISRAYCCEAFGNIGAR